MVKDVPIQYRRWPKPNAPGVLLVHGHAAHARWWDHIGPALHHRFDVSAIDLSGAGDSPHRATYSSRLFAEEMKAVTHHAGYASPIIIAHSFGGTLARVACFLNPHWAQQLILIDSVIPSSAPTSGWTTRKGSRQRQNRRAEQCVQSGCMRHGPLR